MSELRTDRLLMRPWRPEDEEPMAAVNRDPEVTRYLNRRVDAEAVAAFYGQMTAHWETHGFGPFALESREPGLEGTFLGFAGLAFPPPFLSAAGELPELGWRLAREGWGRGLATEAAFAARDHAFGELGLAELISIIYPENARSQRVAAKLGMRLDRHIHNPLLDREVEIWQLAAPQPD
jgi:RimJ/RimL family protein N-acetyltransferase